MKTEIHPLDEAALTIEKMKTLVDRMQEGNQRQRAQGKSIARLESQAEGLRMQIQTLQLELKSLEESIHIRKEGLE